MSPRRAKRPRQDRDQSQDRDHDRDQATPQQPTTQQQPTTHRQPTGLVYDVRMLLHESPGAHPERARRVVRIYEGLQEAGLVARCQAVAARAAVDAELLLVHRPSYVRRLDELEAGEDRHRESASQEFDSVYVSKHTLHSARVAVGGVLEMVRAVAQGRCLNGVAVVRPPGHHAEAHCPMGFCILNNVAIAAAWARRELGVGRVLIVDWDVHFGNGTQQAFTRDADVLYASVHRYDRGQFFPRDANGGPRAVGVGEGKGRTVNVGWSGGGRTDGDYVEAWRRCFMPIFRAFVPDLVLVSAGFDAGARDPIGQCSVTPAGFAHLTRELMTLAAGRVVLALEGGYAVNVLARSATACVRTLLGEAAPAAEELEPATAAGLRSIAATVEAQAPYWPCLSSASASASASAVSASAVVAEAAAVVAGAEADAVVAEAAAVVAKAAGGTL